MVISQLYCCCNFEDETKNYKLFLSNLIQIRIWLNPSVIEAQIQSMRSQAISFMCQLSDRDLRMVATKNTTELMYESFKELNTYCVANNNSSDASSPNKITSSSQTTVASRSSLMFKLDQDGLSLAYKYLLCSTLTIRLCGIAQMNV